jgi:xanthine dehydrogenase accessory factor
MKEILDIVAAYDIAAKQGKKTALATVVLVEGSAYRRAGARMLITEDGQLTGAISGGCLEGDALRKARMVILQQEPMLVTYDTMDDDDAKLGVGLGCNGIIHILIEPIYDHTENPINYLKEIVANRGNAVLVTLFSLENKKGYQPGTCLYATDNHTILNNSLINSPYKSALVDDVKRVIENHQSETLNYTDGSTFTGFVEYVKPLISLVIVGAGNDAIPLTKIAAVLGWNITIIDGRNNYAVADRFPIADRIMVSKPENILPQLDLNGWTAFVLMTHNYNYELALLKQLLPLNLNYIGILGPKKKLERMLGEIEDGGLVITEDQLKSVYGPVGLDIGSESSEEIALCIVAEVKAVLSSRKGYSLKYKPVPIHAAQINAVADK